VGARVPATAASLVRRPWLHAHLKRIRQESMHNNALAISRSLFLSPGLVWSVSMFLCFGLKDIREDVLSKFTLKGITDDAQGTKARRDPGII